MDIVPAIDLRNGKCVRLTRGDYSKETIFEGDPVSIANKWIESGATRLHVVDLDGAKIGKRKNEEIVNKIVRSVNIPIQLGGGIRDSDTAERMIGLGIDRVIFGTAAIESPSEIEHSIKKLGPDKIIVGIDTLEGIVKTRGWVNTTSTKGKTLIKNMEDIGVKRFMFTDTSKDGTLLHPNFESITDILESTKYPVTVGGGVTNIEDLVKLKKIGVESVVIGLAIYSGQLDLKLAIKKIDSRG